MCHKCGDPVGLVSYSVCVYVGEELQVEAILCSTCGGALGSPSFMTRAHQQAIGTGS